MTIACQVVISRFAHDPGWAQHLPCAVIVYNKGKPWSGPLPSMELPNTGRESSTYLFHIVRCYDHLADWTVFVQDHPAPHLADRNIYFLLEPNGGIVCGDLLTDCREWDERGRLVHFGRWRDALLCGQMRHARWSMADWFAKFIGCPLPPAGLCYVRGACFAVSREVILRRPREYYLALLYSLGWDANPEEAYYLERAWLYALGAHEQPTPLRAAMAYRQQVDSVRGTSLPVRAPEMMAGLSLLVRATSLSKSILVSGKKSYQQQSYFTNRMVRKTPRNAQRRTIDLS